MPDMQQLTEETLDAITKAQTTGILESTGAYSYDLTGIVRLIPVVTPFRDKVARKGSPNGSPFAIWRAFMNVNNQQPRATPGFDFAGNEVVFSEQDFQAPYVPVSLAGLVTQDAFDLAKGLFDPYAETTMQVLNQVLIAEDKLLLGAQSYALAQPGTITATPGTAGTMPVNSVQKVAVAARTGSGYYYGGNSRGTASAAVTTAASGSIAASIAAVKGAVAYDWFYSPTGSAPYYYYGTTTVANIVITTAISANNTVSPLPDISSAVPTVNLAADNGSAQANEFNGLLSSLTGDYNAAGQFVTSGTSTTNGAVFIDGGGAALTSTNSGSVDQIETLFSSIWNQVKCSPTALMMNASESQKIANLLLSQPSAVTYLQTNAGDRVGATGGGTIGQIVNAPAGGVTVPIEIETSLPPGVIIARTDRVPFPQANISSVLECRTLRDMSQFDYATNRATGSGGGPRKEFEIRSVEAFINRAPVSMGVLANIQ